MENQSSAEDDQRGWRAFSLRPDVGKLFDTNCDAYGLSYAQGYRSAQFHTEPAADPACETCNGRGTGTASRRVGESDFDEWEETCPVCNGAGTAPAHVQKLYAHLSGIVSEQNARLMQYTAQRMFAPPPPAGDTGAFEPLTARRADAIADSVHQRYDEGLAAAVASVDWRVVTDNVRRSTAQLEAERRVTTEQLDTPLRPVTRT